MTSIRLRDTLRCEIDKISVIDSHEHTESQGFSQTFENHLFRMLGHSFIENDLFMVGAANPDWNAADEGGPSGWLSMKRHINLCRNTGYFRCFLIAVRDLLDIDLDELNDDNWQDVSEKLASAARRPDWYTHVLRERGNIDVVLWDLPPREPSWPEMDRTLFVPVVRLDWLAKIGSQRRRELIAKELGGYPATILDLVDAANAAVARAVERGVAAMKIGIAYDRDLKFGRYPRSEAARIFSMPPSEITPWDLRIYQDFILHQIIGIATKHNLPVQVHTGMQSGPGALHNGNPSHLERTISEHPSTKFVLLHAGYPFTSQATMLGSKYPNVYVDASWLPVLSPSVYRAVISDWLDRVPVDRIIAWGGDAVRVEMTYGSLAIVKNVVANVLAEKVGAGLLRDEEAVQIAHKVFRQNPLTLFQTDEARRRRIRAAQLQERVA